MKTNSYIYIYIYTHTHILLLIQGYVVNTHNEQRLTFPLKYFCRYVIFIFKNRHVKN